MVQAGDQGKFVVILLFDNYCFFDVNECIYTYMYIDAMQVHEHIDNKKVASHYFWALLISISALAIAA